MKPRQLWLLAALAACLALTAVLLHVMARPLLPKPQASPLTRPAWEARHAAPRPEGAHTVSGDRPAAP